MTPSLVRRLALPLLLAPALSSPAAASGVELTYEVWSSAMQVMDLTITYQVEGEGYRIGLDAELIGPPALFDSYRLRSTAEGRLLDGVPMPVAYHTETKTDSKKVKWIELAFEAGLPLMTSDPPFSPNIRPALEDAERQDSRDPLSAVIALLQATTAAVACTGESQVYDGRRRFDLKMLEHPGAMPNGLLKPATLSCAVQLTPVAGYRFDGEDKTEVSSGTILYLAEIAPDLPLLPVRIDAETGYGGVELDLVKVTPLP